MECQECKHQNPPGRAECLMCGVSLRPTRQTRLDAVDAPPMGSPDAAAVEVAPSPGGTPESPNAASRKRRTVYDPDTSGTRASDPFAAQTSPRSAIDPGDPFGSAAAGGVSAPPRDPEPAHPWTRAPAPLAAPDPAPVARAPDPAPSPGGRSRSSTIIEHGPVGAERVQGVLVEYAHPSDRGRLHALAAGRNTIGRDDDQDVVLSDDGRVSGRHALIFLRSSGATFIDISRNGSVVDGAPVFGEQCELQHGSILRLGAGCFVFVQVPDVPADAWSAR